MAPIPLGRRSVRASMEALQVTVGHTKGRLNEYIEDTFAVERRDVAFESEKPGRRQTQSAFSKPRDGYTMLTFDKGRTSLVPFVNQRHAQHLCSCFDGHQQQPGTPNCSQTRPTPSE